MARRKKLNLKRVVIHLHTQITKLQHVMEQLRGTTTHDPITFAVDPHGIPAKEARDLAGYWRDIAVEEMLLACKAMSVKYY